MEEIIRHLMRKAFGAFVGLAGSLHACNHASPAATPAAPAAAPATSSMSAAYEAAEVVYDAGFRNGWQDWGWSPREIAPGQPAKVRFDNWGGWIIAKPGQNGDFGGLRFRMRMPRGEDDIVRVALWSDAVKMDPVKINREHHVAEASGWIDVFVPFEQLNPNGQPFDRVVFLAARAAPAQPVELDNIALTKPVASPSSAVDRSKARPVVLSVDCRAKVRKVSPYIFGFASYPFEDAKKQAAAWLNKGTTRRWGGNATSIYNWELGAWNTGSDWFFENHPISHRTFFEENAVHGVVGAVTVPMMGWVSKDVVSSSFAVSAVGQQQAVDQWRPEAGNGKDKNGKELAAGAPSRAYQPVTPAFVKRWIASIREADAKSGKRSVWMYILDNEPMIWNHTHRDVHPEPLTYDELLERTIQYGTAVREADPEAVIAGPAEWGWPNYFYSAKDMENGGPSVRPDRRAHGDLPLVAYYLKSLAEYEKKSGVRVLDVLDLHGYPYADGVSGTRGDAQAAELRVRSTRMLWDPSYVDESWVKEPVKLLPRMQEWVDQYYPGRGLSLGEWNFGGETHISGGIATAEALGRFVQFGVTSAFYWYYPPENSPAMWAFRAYRDYDGKGGHFLDWFTPSSARGEGSPPVSLFVSRDDSGGKLVAVLLNLSRRDGLSADIDLSTCGKLGSLQSWSYEGGTTGFAKRAPENAPQGSKVTELLAPFSITVLEAKFDEPAPVVHGAN